MTEQERPTFAWVKTELERRRVVLRAMHVAMDLDEDWLDAGADEAARARVIPHILGLPQSNWTPRLVPLAYLGVMVGVNQVHVGESIEAQWKIPEGRYEEADRKERERVMSRWLRGLIYTMDTYTTDSLVRELMIKLIGLGEGCLTYSVNYDQWPDPPFGWTGRGKNRRPREPRPEHPGERDKYERWQNTRARSFPFTIESCHPTALFFDPDHAIPFDFIREERIRKPPPQPSGEVVPPETAETQQAAGIIDAVDASETVMRITYVSPFWMGQWVNNEPLFTGKNVIDGVKPNTSGLPLHRMAWGGFGSNNRSGDFVSKGRGIIRDGRDLIAQKISLLNVLEQLRGVTAFPPLIVTGPDPLVRARIKQSLIYAPGEVIDIPEGYRVISFPEVTVPNVVFQQIEQVDAMLETHFGPAILRGQAQAGETLGGQRNRYTIATAIYRAAKQAGQQLLAAVLMDLAYLVKYELRESCPVLAGQDGTIVTISPDDIDDGGMAIVNFSPPTADEKAFKAEGIRKDLESGLLSPEEAAVAMGIEDAKTHIRAVRVQKGIDLVLGSDAWGQHITQLALQAMGVQPPQPQPGGTPDVQATPSGQPLTKNGGVPQGNPEQQQAIEDLNAAYAPPVRRG